MPDSFVSAVVDWYSREARTLPWREKPVDPWGVLVSEFMLQQTPVDRVLPRYCEWMERWPTPADLAAAAPGDALRAWDRLGYPRRALWLHSAAVEITRAHSGAVPRDLPTLLNLTGVGPYTARAVAAFAFGDRHPVVDTNTRRVIARAVHGRAAAGHPRSSDLEDMDALLPVNRRAAQSVNAGLMELGATVCTARSPRCSDCPIALWCEWRGAGFPDNAPAARPRQAAYAGSDRQVRGRILARLRRTPNALTREEALDAAAAGVLGSRDQPERALESLVRDGLVIVRSDTRIALP